MYCNKCGTRLSGTEKFCFHCGASVNLNNNLNNQSNKTQNQSNGKKTVSIILGIISLVGTCLIIFSPLNIIVSLIGLIIGIAASKEVSNAPGIILNAISLFLSLIITAIIAFVVMIIINVSKNVDIEDVPWDDITNKFVESRF